MQSANIKLTRAFSIAPMMDWSDRHCRYFWRLLTKQSLLYTEMITTGALIHGDAAAHLEFNDIEHPIAVQLGGNDPQDLAKIRSRSSKIHPSHPKTLPKHDFGGYGKILVTKMEACWQ